MDGGFEQHHDALHTFGFSAVQSRWSPLLKIGLDSFRRTKGGAGLPPPLMTESSSRVSRVTMLAWNYAARVLLFPDRATFAFLADFVATNPVSVGAAAAALLPELSTEVVRISR
jgi:hypothetical protein